MVYFDFVSALNYLDTFGLTQLFLPFIFLFTIIFAILQKVGIFREKGQGDAVGKPNKKVNGIIALVISLLTVIPHVTGGYPAGYDVVTIINTILPGSVLIIIAIVMFLMLAGLGGSPIKGSTYTSLVGLVAVLGLVWVVWNAIWPDTLPSWLNWIQDPGLQSLLIILLVGGLVIYFIVRDDSKPTEWTTELKNLFK